VLELGIKNESFVDYGEEFVECVFLFTVCFYSSCVRDYIFCFFEEFFEEILGVIDITADESSCRSIFTRFFVSLPHGIPKTFCFVLAEEIVHFPELHVLVLAN
jgi:hypothetical protein